VKPWRKIVVVGLFVGLTLVLAGFADSPPEGVTGPADGRPECPSCPGKDVPQEWGSCPFTITIQCWCETPIYVCCIRQICVFPHDWAPYCNYCWFYEECYVQDCGAIIPEIATLPDGRRPL
jgi:hypothetical protein